MFVLLGPGAHFLVVIAEKKARYESADYVSVSVCVCVCAFVFSTRFRHFRSEWRKRREGTFFFFCFGGGRFFFFRRQVRAARPFFRVFFWFFFSLVSSFYGFHSVSGGLVSRPLAAREPAADQSAASFFF